MNQNHSAKILANKLDRNYKYFNFEEKIQFMPYSFYQHLKQNRSLLANSELRFVISE